ncbi:nibrin-related [Holotrichia oblita]|uniref:Nibrin-related n=2 Tax=Holotrichia oblita TaxID=644536 RepID=A0ACB9TWS2_HOLOL|nr:nibrin-related [Holotrichia oblita]KAI4471212.1 nibrin-related [Holotrichia oblita]
MHFILSKQENKAFYLFDGRDYTVGRKDCDILIKDDTSISRKHATLSVKQGKMYITDLGAKYKTFVNSVPLLPQEITALKVDDEIKFGMLQSIFTVKEQKLNVTTSGLNPDEKKVLARVLKRLDGNVAANWSKECSYLTVREIMLTLKVLCALIEKQPIVTINFWTDYIKHVNENRPPPDPRDYKAAYAENVLNKNFNFKEDCCRKSLFKNKVFIFKNKVSKAKIEAVIKLAVTNDMNKIIIHYTFLYEVRNHYFVGGTSFHWNEKIFAKKHLSSSNPQYLLIQDGTENSDNTFTDMISHLHSLGKRSIPFQEIAMAVVLASCEKDCNPDFDRTGTLLKEKEQIIFTSDILAPETQTQDYKAEDLSSIIVPETVENALPCGTNMDSDKSKESCVSSVKREAEDLGNHNKKPKLEDTEEKETYSNVFPGGSRAENNIVTSTQKQISPDIVKSSEPYTSFSEKDSPTDKNEKNFKRAAQEVNSNEKRRRLDEKQMNIDGWLTASKNTPIAGENSKSIDLTLDDEVVICTRKEKNIADDSNVDDQVKKNKRPFSFDRCSTASKPKLITKMSEFLKPTNPSGTTTRDTIVIDLDSPSTSGKRSCDNTSPNRSAKKQVLMNPFSLKSKDTKNDTNRFEKNTIIKENTKTNNPFPSLKKSKPSSNQDTTKEVQKPVSVPYRFNVTVIDTEMDENHGWLSRNSILKDEVDNTFKIFDETMQKFMESFRNCIIVEKQDLVVKRPAISSETTTSTTAKTNFKKFKKVQPLHIQTSIIPRARYVDTLNSDIEVM